MSTLTALFSFFALSSFAQLNTIEVSVSETVSVPVKEYVYQVSNSKINSNGLFDFDFDDYEDEYSDEEEEVFSMPKTISWMKKELEAAKFKCTLVPSALYDVEPDQTLEDANSFDREVIEIRVNSLEELSRLSKFVLQLEDAYGELTNIEFEDVSTTYDVLFPAMIKKANQKASKIASAAGKKVGDVVQITEGKDGINLYGDEFGEYMDAMMEMGTKLWKKNVPTDKQLKVTMKCVIELK